MGGACSSGARARGAVVGEPHGRARADKGQQRLHRLRGRRRLLLVEIAERAPAAPPRRSGSSECTVHGVHGMHTGVRGQSVLGSGARAARRSASPQASRTRPPPRRAMPRARPPPPPARRPPPPPRPPRGARPASPGTSRTSAAPVYSGVARRVPSDLSGARCTGCTGLWPVGAVRVWPWSARARGSRRAAAP